MKELVIDRPGTYLGVRKGLFVVKNRDGSSTEFSPVELSHISVRCRGVGVSVDALKLACRFGIELTVYHQGKPVSKVLHALKGGGVLTKQAQLEATKDGRGLSVAKSIVYAKLFNQRFVLQQRLKVLLAKRSSVAGDVEVCVNRITEAMNSAHNVENLDSLRAYEAVGAVSYWKGVGAILPADFGFEGREAWSPKDTFNKALNIGYGVLRSRVWSAVLSANLDPYIGFLHLPRGRHMCLVSDLMEEFRPGVVDRSLLVLALEKPAVLLDEKMLEKSVVTAVVRMLTRNDGFFERAIAEQARRLSSYLRGEIPEYVGFRMRW